MNKPHINIDSFWLPRQSSTLAEKVDFGYYAAYWTGIVFFLLITGATVYLVLKYRRRTEKDKTSPIAHNTALEVTWSLIPLVILIWLFFVGLRSYVYASVAPAESYEIKVTGEMYLWTFIYPDGTAVVNELAVPKGRPVKLIMSSKDVLHSLYIPEFRVKQDVVPGLYTTIWFNATNAGDTALLCTEYCGSGHSDMLATVKVLEESDFEKWIEQQSGPSDLPPEELGKLLYAKKSCATCHSVDGSPMQGPTFKGIFGRNEEFSDGSRVAVDENYIRESILNPQAKVVKGFPAVMPTFRGLLKDREIDALIAYLKTVK
ncbi:cytochrome c oxidase subunit II [Chondromyces apiculatus]|uniref:Cytochrome c oxidase subunit 2 n=1 Tax=Chondromyces apiculatus DSM 436 TaxID=1192034 RepID=A0A017TD08_9BACT|nr:cytochrome c oxidase subunit II [Chondromyces apiculatus]EYF06501.1 Cytochrome c oxidase polypeptide II [Chondromyces apiculatus DSM 436]